LLFRPSQIWRKSGRDRSLGSVFVLRTPDLFVKRGDNPAKNRQHAVNILSISLKLPEKWITFASLPVKQAGRAFNPQKMWITLWEKSSFLGKMS